MSVLVSFGIVVGAVIALLFSPWIAFWTGVCGSLLFIAYGVGQYTSQQRSQR